jgi:long-chain-fatty-acid--CoA ligase ACSBG
VYATNTAEACLYIAGHSKAEIIVVEGNKQLVKYTDLNDNNISLLALKAIVVWGEPIDASIAAKVSCQVYSWESFLALGATASDANLDTLVDSRGTAMKPGHCATLIYTSGTTGPPKAVMLSHDNITWTTKAMCSHYVEINSTDRFLSFLPLSHIAAQLIDIHVPMTEGAATYFAQPDALKGSLINSIKDVRPTIFFGVPRVWEKIQEKMVQVWLSDIPSHTVFNQQTNVHYNDVHTGRERDNWS